MSTSIIIELEKIRTKNRKAEDQLIDEVNRILIEEQFSGRNVLKNLKSYIDSFELANEPKENAENIFSQREIKKLCIKYRLRFVDSKELLSEIPYPAILKITEYNKTHGKELRHFKIIATREFLLGREKKGGAVLLAQTIYGNYLLIHQWGESIDPSRNQFYFPLRSFENLFFCVLILSLVITLVLPTSLITTDFRANYFSMYRIACFFHVTIFVTSFTVFGLFAFHSDLSNRNWNSIR